MYSLLDCNLANTSGEGGFQEIIRKPRRVNSEDWRTDSTRGRGDGEEDIGSKEWKLGGPKRDGWRGGMALKAVSFHKCIFCF